MSLPSAGAEWEELEWLVSSPEDMDKIRTFDMEAQVDCRGTGTNVVYPRTKSLT